MLPGDADKTSIKARLETKQQHSEEKLAKDGIGSDHRAQTDKKVADSRSVIKIVSTVKVTSDVENEKENPLEREIRLSRERDAELKLEKESRLNEQKRDGQSEVGSMPIRKVPEPVKIELGGHMTKEVSDVPPLPTSPVPSGSAYSQLPEVDRDTAVLKRENIIDVEIRQQQERENALLKAGYTKTQQVNKVCSWSDAHFSDMISPHAVMYQCWLKVKYFPEYNSLLHRIIHSYHSYIVRFITFGGRSAHLAYHVHKIDRKT